MDLLAALDCLAACYGGAVSGRAAFGPRKGQRAVQLGRVGDPPKSQRKGYLCAQAHGFNLHAAVTIRPGDRTGLERICRYLARPPLAHDRLELLDEDHVSIRLKRRWSDGTTHVVLTFSELLQRLAALVPRPGTHRIRYHGIFASRARHRSLILPKPPPHHDDVNAADETDDKSPIKLAPNQRFRRLLWAELLVRVFGNTCDPLACERCGGRMRLISSIHKADVIQKILECTGEPNAPPELRRARGPPQRDMYEFDWSTPDWSC